MSLNEKLLQSLLPGNILSVQIGLSRTAVVAETDEGLRCGLSAALSNPGFDHYCNPPVRNSGELHKMSYSDLAGLVESQSFTEVSIGIAAINALLPRKPDQWVELNAEDYLIEHARNKNVVVVGHFPFVDRLKPLVNILWVLELNPINDDLPAHTAPNVIPHADIVAITATTLINKTFQGLIEFCRPNARVILIGPSTPLSPVMYDYGVDVLSGTIVIHPQVTLMAVGQGVTLQQLRQRGLVKYVTMHKGAPE